MPVSAPPDIPPPPSPPKVHVDDDEMDTEEDTFFEAKNIDHRAKAATESIEGPPVTFKDLIERRASQRNIIFIPKGKQYNGRVS